MYRDTDAGALDSSASASDGGASSRLSESNVLASTVKSAVVEYMRFHGYSSALKAFLSEASEHPPTMDTVELSAWACLCAAVGFCVA